MQSWRTCPISHPIKHETANITSYKLHGPMLVAQLVRGTYKESDKVQPYRCLLSQFFFSYPTPLPHAPLGPAAKLIGWVFGLTQKEKKNEEEEETATNTKSESEAINTALSHICVTMTATTTKPFLLSGVSNMDQTTPLCHIINHVNIQVI